MSPAGNLPGADPFPLWLSTVLFGAAFFLCAELGRFLSVQDSSYVSLWLPAGLYMGMLLRHPTREWPWLMLAALVAGLAFDLRLGTPFVTALGFYAANTVEALLGAWLVRRFVAPRLTLTTLREFLGLTGFGAIVGPVAGATVGAATLVLSGLADSFPKAWEVWWGSNAMAILLVGPLVLTWGAPSGTAEGSRWWRQPARLLEAGVLVAGLVGFTWHMLVLDRGIMAPYKSRLMLFVLWAGLRFGPRGATAVNLLLALLMAFLTVHYRTGLTPAQISSGEYVLPMQSFLVLAALIGLIPAIVLQERDRTLTDLRVSEERFRTLATASFEGICLSEGGRILDVNEPMLKMFRCRREELIGGDLLDLVSPESLAEAAECVRAEQEDAHELLLRRPDGSTFSVETQARMIRIGPRTIRMNALRDITARRQLFIALEQQRQRLEGIVNSATDGIITVDGDQRIVVFNPAAERIFQCPAESALGQPIARFIPGLSPSRLAELAQPLVQAVTEPVAKGQSNVGPGRRASGEEFPLETSLARIPLGDQRLVTLTCRDLTDLLRTEAARQQLESQLRQAQKMDAVGTLAGGIAHDFNNILAAIIAYAELAKLTAPENALLQEHLQLLLKSSDRAAGLVRQLLSFSQQQRQDHRNLQLAPVLADVLRQLRSSLPVTIELVPDLDQEVPAVRADTARIQQVLRNLVENAADALKHKGGQIYVTLDLLQLDADAPRPHLTLRADRYVRLTVRDNGQGMDRETLKRVFEPFFTTKEPGKGTGLGLAVAHGVIKTHGGIITAESEPGRGTTFTIYLPPARAEAAPSPTAHVVI